MNLKADPHCRLGGILLAVAFALGLAAGLHDVTGPWESGLRGAGAFYTDSFVEAFLARGICQMHGIPGFLVQGPNGATVLHDWHHPPIYWLYLTLVASVLGNEPAVLRLGHLLLWLPSIGILFVLVRCIAGSLVAGCTSVLHVAVPMTGYFGPMLLPEGAATTAGLATLWLLHRHLERPSLGRLLVTCAAYFVTTQFDFISHLWGIAALILTMDSCWSWRSIKAVLALLCVSILSACLNAVHYGFLFGGPLQFLQELMRIASNASAAALPIENLDATAAIEAWAWQWIGMPHLVLAVVGLGVAWSWSATSRRAIVLAAACGSAGVAACVLTPHHAVLHAFWPLQGMTGLAVLGAFVPAAGVVGLMQRRWSLRMLGAVACLGGIGAVGSGVWATHLQIATCAVDPRAVQLPENRELKDLLRGCSMAISHDELGDRGQLVGVAIFGGIDTPAELELMWGLATKGPVRGNGAYVLATNSGGLPTSRELLERLGEIGTPVHGEYWLVYRFSY